MVWQRWLIAVGVGTLPLLAGLAAQQPAGKVPSAARPHAKVTNPHGPLAIPCQNCHTYTSWKPIRAIPEFNHASTSYPLRGMHQSVGCTQCHSSPVFKNVSKSCADCHADIHRRQFGANCEKCHTVKGWQVSIKAIQDHQNRFPLVGTHALVECDACHTNAAAGQYTGLSTACFSCHQKDYLTPVIDHVGAKFGTTCQTCHSMDSWLGASFNHLAVTGFALTGMHATLACTSCHLNNVYKGTPATCYACHSNEFVASNNPSHLQLGLPHDCGICHSTTNWLNATFNHSLYGNYPLTGLHANVPCAQCHVNNNYTLTTTACYACHQTAWAGTTNPNHTTAGFPTDCSICHTTSGWNASSFNHSKGAFPLMGAHLTVACAQCHVNGNYTTVPIGCYACHQSAWAGTNNPNHLQLGLPHDCSVCHSTTNWLNASFNHTLYGNYPLTGLHANVPCLQCHVNNNYTLTTTACYSCHQTAWAGTTNPNHTTAGFPTDCSVCHTTSGWNSSTFNHSTGAFPLTGAHLTVACTQCHVNGNYTTVPTACYSCHSNAYVTSTNPSHLQLGLPHECATCHSTTNWLNASFNHSLYGNYPLTGLHANVPCAQCHVNNNYTLTTTVCYSCHQTAWAGTTNPNHTTAGFPTDCSICHSTSGWSPASFNHSTGAFPLTGAHLTVACAQCHVNGNYTTVPTACYACHQTAWAGTTNPNHASAGFPTTCETCHNTTAWTGAVFNHNNTPFPLTGAHITVACTACHINNVFVSTPTDCYSCHTAAYRSTTNPNHVTAGFPTTCATCHTTTAWTGATFNHTWFPTSHGNANGVCSSCHTNSSNYAVFTCTSCHSAAATNPRHSGVSGYVYNSTNCYACHHSGGRGGGDI